METKFKEVIITTSDVNQMRDKFLAVKLVRGWQEDFIDEDSGEVISIDRNELILEKGNRLKDSELSLINFHLQTKDIENVTVSNQQRTGTLGKREATVWQVTANYNNKKYNLFLYSNSIEKTKEIVTDYLEQKVSGLFSFVGMKELEYSTLIPLEFLEQLDDENPEIESVDFEADYYKIEVDIVDEDYSRRESFIVNATDAEDAKETIIKFLSLKHFEQTKKGLAEDYQFETTIITAKTIPCDYVIDYEFSLEYLKDESES